MEVENELPKRILCDYPGCLAKFTRLWKMKEHLSVHTGQKPYKCDQEECQKTFTRKSHLQRHTRQHLGQKPFGCQKEGCEMKFKTPNQRKIHERKHDGYHCSFKECQLVATTWTQLQKHLKTHPISVEYSCTSCERKFKCSSALRRHKRIHAAQGFERTCPMEDCKLNFRMAFNLEHHIRKDHFKILEYKCYFPDCQKAFAMKESLHRHLVVHDPERKRLNINRDCRQKWSKGQRNLVIEEKLTRLFKEKPIFKLKSKIECDLSGLFNERKITHPVSHELSICKRGLLPAVLCNFSFNLWQNETNREGDSLAVVGR
ncbi:P43 5S RNA-binding protein-like [Heterodontus francisci]|uniref:P43 5S RNA-binding protein-like n=1 Tax=Heterodontus francisci TaxID=7792 RepID=UPI00355BCBB4